MAGRGEWRDAPDRPMEDQINQILGAIAGGFEEIRLRRERETEAEKRRWEVDKEHQRLEMERKREVVRCRGLVSKAEAWRTAAEIRAFVEAVRNRFAGTDEAQEAVSFETWSGWALDQANRIDPLEADDLFDLDVSESEVWALRD